MGRIPDQNIDHQPQNFNNPSLVNQSYQSQPPRPQTPPPVYPPPPVQFPPPPDHGQQYNQFHQQPSPQPQPQPQPMNNNFDGVQQFPYNKPMPQPSSMTSGIPIVAMSSNEGWRTELFDCMDDPMNAIVTLCFPCLTFGQIAEIIDNGQTSCVTSGLIYGLVASFTGLPCIMSCSYRTKLRNKYGLIESPAPDLITHFLCEPCALCQAYRELQIRGLDPSIGWIGNVAKQQQQQQAVMMAAPTYQSMNG